MILQQVISGIRGLVPKSNTFRKAILVFGNDLPRTRLHPMGYENQRVLRKSLTCLCRLPLACGRYVSQPPFLTYFPSPLSACRIPLHADYHPLGATKSSGGTSSAESIYPSHRSKTQYSCARMLKGFVPFLSWTKIVIGKLFH